MAAEEILLQVFLDQRRKAVESLVHVRMAERQMHLHACRDNDHDAFFLPGQLPLTSAAPLSAGANTRRPSSGSIVVIPSSGCTRFARRCERSHVIGRADRKRNVASCGAFRAAVRPNWTH
jgi:hypothetical protein